MLGAVDWSNLTVAGAFILGAVLGAVATLRLARAIISLFDDARRRRNGED